jgi:hypothetical protein
MPAPFSSAACSISLAFSHSLDGALGDVQCLGDFPLAVTAEVAHLHHLGEARIDLLQRLERIVHAKDLVLAGWRLFRHPSGQRQEPQAGTPLFRRAFAGARDDH